MVDSDALIPNISSDFLIDFVDPTEGYNIFAI